MPNYHQNVFDNIVSSKKWKPPVTTFYTGDFSTREYLVLQINRIGKNKNDKIRKKMEIFQNRPI